MLSPLLFNFKISNFLDFHFLIDKFYKYQHSQTLVLPKAVPPTSWKSTMQDNLLYASALSHSLYLSAPICTIGTGKIDFYILPRFLSSFAEFQTMKTLMMYNLLFSQFRIMLRFSPLIMTKSAVLLLNWPKKEIIFQDIDIMYWYSCCGYHVLHPMYFCTVNKNGGGGGVLAPPLLICPGIMLKIF